MTQSRKLLKRKFTLNGQPQEVDVDGHETLQHLPQERLQLSECRRGCDRGDCGVCTVMLDGQPVYACLVMAAEVDQSIVETAQGLSAANAKYQRLQRAFQEHALTLCHLCRPGLLVSASALLGERPAPSQEQIRAAISGHLCRCSGPDQVVRAVLAAADGGKVETS